MFGEGLGGVFKRQQKNGEIRIILIV